VIGAKRRWGEVHFSVVVSSLRLLGPFSTRRWELWRTRSQIASAMVGSPRWSCHLAGGSWLVMMVERLPYLRRSKQVSELLP
jgi:hypothetical protein